MDITRLLEAGSYLVTILGVPVAIFLFIRERRIDRDLKIREIYGSVDNAYTDFIKTALEHPEIDVLRADAQMSSMKVGGSVEHQRKQWLLICLLISIFERAYLLYRQSPSELLRTQWDGWESWAMDYLCRTDVRAVWDAIGKDFDTSFHTHIECLLAGTEPPPMRTSRWG